MFDFGYFCLLLLLLVVGRFVWLEFAWVVIVCLIVLFSCRGLVVFCVVWCFCALVNVLVGIVLVVNPLSCSFVGSLVLVWCLLRLVCFYVFVCCVDLLLCGLMFCFCFVGVCGMLYCLWSIVMMIGLYLVVWFGGFSLMVLATAWLCCRFICFPGWVFDFIVGLNGGCGFLLGLLLLCSVIAVGC